MSLVQVDWNEVTSERGQIWVVDGARRAVVGTAKVAALGRLGIQRLAKFRFRRPGRRGVVALYSAIAYQFRRLADREVAILMNEVRVAIPALRLQTCLQAHSQDKWLEVQVPASDARAWQWTTVA